MGISNGCGFPARLPPPPCAPLHVVLSTGVCISTSTGGKGIPVTGRQLITLSAIKYAIISHIITSAGTRHACCEKDALLAGEVLMYLKQLPCRGMTYVAPASYLQFQITDSDLWRGMDEVRLQRGKEKNVLQQSPFTLWHEYRFISLTNTRYHCILEIYAFTWEEGKKNNNNPPSSSRSKGFKQKENQGRKHHWDHLERQLTPGTLHPCSGCSRAPESSLY